MDVRVPSSISSCDESTSVRRILRPSFFMENFEGAVGRVTATVLRCGLNPRTKMGLIVRTRLASYANNVDARLVRLLRILDG